MENIPPPDFANLRVAFQKSFSPQAEHIKEAETLLKKWEKSPGFAVTLLQVASSDVDISEKQAAAVCLKNFCKRKWASAEHPIPEADKNTIKDNLIDVLISAPPKVRAQIAALITDIASPDFPSKWPSFLPKVGNLIASHNPHYMHGALLALQRAIKKYQYMNAKDERRAPLYAIVKDVFPTLLQIFSMLCPLDTAESGLMLKLICKIFESATKMAMPPSFVDPAILEGWMGVFLPTLERPVPDALLPPDAEGKSKHPLWQTKKWISRIMERFIKRYGGYDDEENSPAVHFKNLFLQKYAIRVLGSALQVLSFKKAGAFVSDRVAQSLIAYVDVCIRHSITWLALKPHLAQFNQEIIFPYLWLTDKDMELWQDDPQEYLRKEADFMEEFFNPRNAAMSFLLNLVRYRGPDHLHQFMNFVVSVLMQYEATPLEKRRAEVSLVRAKDGALVVIGTLAPYLKRINEYSVNLEKMILAHVFPELTSPVGFLRARACWLFSQFYNAKFENPANFAAGLRQVVTMMRDPDLPVSISAAFSLKFLIRATTAKDELRPVLPQILEEYFKLMTEIDHQDLVSTLESLIDTYGEEMAPYAVGLCQRLAEVFMRQFKSDDEDDHTDSPMECLVAISSLLRGIKDLTHIYLQVEPVLIPLILTALDEDGIGYFDEIFTIATYLTFYPNEVSPQMWAVFAKICEIANSFAIDFIEDMVAPLDNFITKGTAVFLSPSTPYLDMICTLYNKLVTDFEVNEIDAGEACKLIESVLHNCRSKNEPRVDAVLPGIVEIAVHRLLNSAKALKLQVLLLEVIANALYYNPALTLHTLETKGHTAAVFTLWFRLIPKFKDFYDKKLVILGLSAIFGVGYNNLPPLVQNGSKQILDTLMKLIGETEEMRKEQELEKLDKDPANQKKSSSSSGDAGEAEEEEEDDEEGSFKNIPDNEDVPTDDEDLEDMEIGLFASQYAKYLKGEEEDGVDEGDLYAEVEGGEEGGEEEEEAEEEEEDEEDDEYDEELDDEEYDTFIDTIDELVYFVTKLQWMFHNEPQVYQQLVGVLNQSIIQTWTNTAQLRVNAALAEQQNKNGATATR